MNKLTSKILVVSLIFVLYVFQGNIMCENTLNSIKFIANGQIGFLAGQNGLLYKTSDAGNTWFLVPLNITNNLNKISSDGVNIIVIACDDGKILRSDDRGNTWNYFNSGLNSNILNLNITVKGKGFIATGGSLYNTDDYGLSWKICFTRTGAVFNSLSDYGENSSILAGNNNFIFTTRDGGHSWTKPVMPSSFHLDFNYAKMFDNALAFTASTTGSIVKTSDGGNTWNIVYSSPGNNLIHAIENTAAGNILAAGDNGTMLLSSNMGSSWSPINSDTRVSLYCLAFTDSLTGLAAGDNKTIVKTTDGGNTWNPVGYTLQNPHSSVINNKVHEVTLNQNFPNPFNPTTSISYILPFSSAVSLKVYDMLGREVRTIADGVQPAGNHSYSFDASNLSSGIYFYILNASNGVSKISKTMRMILTK